MIKQFKDQKIRNLIKEICNEHWTVAKPEDSNIGYLWHMYAAGNKRDEFRPFIFLSELNLLVKTGYVTEEEKQNMLGMLLSEDEDNANIMAFSILTLRAKRVEEMGIWTYDNEKYNQIDYIRDIINTELFMNQKI
jgi:hypothetical protein